MGVTVHFWHKLRFLPLLYFIAALFTLSELGDWYPKAVIQAILSIYKQRIEGILIIFVNYFEDHHLTTSHVFAMAWLSEAEVNIHLPFYHSKSR